MRFARLLLQNSAAAQVLSTTAAAVDSAAVLAPLATPGVSISAAGAAEARAKYEAQLLKVRLDYFNQLVNNPVALEQRRREYADRVKVQKIKNADPLIVGVGLYRTRRATRRALILNFGRLPQIPSAAELAELNAKRKAEAAEKVRVRALKHPAHTADADLRAIFYRDIRPDNPRLLHLLHLWHDSEHFVTERNLEKKLGAFFDDYDDTEVSGLDEFGLRSISATDRLYNIVEYGVPESYSTDAPAFSAHDFGSVDRSFRVGGDAEIPALEMGNPAQQMLTRETVVKDAMHGSLVGRPGVMQMLRLASQVPLLDCTSVDQKVDDINESLLSATTTV